MAPVLPHVPAWKRIGLKLKYEDGESNGAASQPSVTNSTSKKRTWDGHSTENSQHELDSQTKRRKFDSNLIESQPLDRKVLQKTKAEHRDSLQPVKQKRKSVSFASDAKQSDGQSVKELLETWEAEQDSEQGVTQTIAADREKTFLTNGNGEIKSSKKEKKPRKSKTGLAQSREVQEANGSGPETGPSSFLGYLSEFQQSNDSWKFNKAKQTHLLKRVFDLDQVPWDYNAALKDYLIGLKGDQIKAKLREDAVKIRDDDEAALKDETLAPEKSRKDLGEAASDGSQANGDMSGRFYGGPSAADRQREYKQALKRYKRELKDNALKHEEWDLLKDPHFKKRLQKRMRAELVLWCDGQSGSATTDDKMVVSDGEGGHIVRPGVIEHTPLQNGTQQGANGHAANGQAAKGPKRKRKRKRRTGLPDDDTSSESSDISSDSSVDQAPVVAKNAKSLPGGAKRNPESTQKTKRRTRSKSGSSSSDETSSGSSDTASLDSELAAKPSSSDAASSADSEDESTSQSGSDSGSVGGSSSGEDSKDSGSDDSTSESGSSGES